MSDRGSRISDCGEPGACSGGRPRPGPALIAVPPLGVALRHRHASASYANHGERSFTRWGPPTSYEPAIRNPPPAAETVDDDQVPRVRRPGTRATRDRGCRANACGYAEARQRLVSKLCQNSTCTQRHSAAESALATQQSGLGPGAHSFQAGHVGSIPIARFCSKWGGIKDLWPAMARKVFALVGLCQGWGRFCGSGVSRWPRFRT